MKEQVRRIALGTLVVALGATPLLAQQAAANRVEFGQMARPNVPADTAILELDAPTEAKVTVNGKDYGMRRRFDFRPFKPGQLFPYDVRVQFQGAELRRTVLLQAGWYARLPWRTSNAPKPGLILQTGHAEDIYSVAYSPSGQHILTGSLDGTTILWEVDTGRQVRVFPCRDIVYSLAFSPDGKQILTSSADNTATLWEIATGRKASVFKGHSSSILSVAFRADGQRVVTGGYDNTAILWNAATGEKLRTFKASPLYSSACSPDGRQVVTGSANEAFVWDAATGQKLRTLKGHTSLVTSVTYSPDGKLILTGGYEGVALLWDSSTGRNVRKFTAEGSVRSIAYSPDGTKILIGTDSPASLWDVATGEKVRVFKGHSRILASVAFSPDGQRIVTAGHDRIAILWDVATGLKVRTLQGRTDFVSSVAFRPDGKQAVTAFGGAGGVSVSFGADGRPQMRRPETGGTTAIIWDMVTGQKLRTLAGHTCAICSVAYSEDGTKVLTGSTDSTAIVWDSENGQKLHAVEGRMNALSHAFGPGGKQMIVGAGEKTAVVVWDIASGQELRTLEDTDFAYSVNLSSDGNHALTGSSTTSLWDVAAGRKIRSFRQSASVGETALSPDGKRALIGADLWDVPTGQKLHALGATSPAVFSPEGRRLLTGAKNEAAVIWDVASGQRLCTFQGHSGSILSATFSADGQRVLIGSSDGTARLWDVATADELARLISFQGEEDWLVLTPEGLFDGSDGGRQKVSFRVGDGLTVVPVDRFFQDFYRPGLLAEIWAGERPVPDVELGNRRPPLLRIVNVHREDAAGSSRVTLEVEATDQGGGIHGPWLVHNGARVPLTGAAETKGRAVRRSMTAGLIPGENRLEVRAASHDGSWESEPAQLVLGSERRQEAADLYLLAVGINRYSNAVVRNLRYADADAEAVAELFRKRGPAQYNQVHVIRLIDEQATTKAIRASLADFARRVKPQDTLIVFLAGHGLAVGQRYYFIPHEFRLPEGEKLTEAEIRSQGLASDVLGDWVGEASALQRVLLFDTCQSGGVTASALRRQNPFAFRGAIERLSRTQGVFTIAASSAGEDASEVRDLGHGVLTYALLAGLGAVEHGPLLGKTVRAGDAAPVDILAWFSFAAAKVPELSEQYGFNQEVHMSGRGHSFAVLPLNNPSHKAP